MADWTIVVPHQEVSRLEELIYGIPDPRLAAHVLTYTAHDYTHTKRLRWRMTPLGAITVSLDIETPDRLVFSQESESGQRLPGSPVIGLRDRPMILEQAGKACGINIAMTPLGAHALFGLPLGELAGASVGFTDLLGTRGHELIERIAETRGWAARFRLLDERFVSWLGDGPQLARPVQGAWQRLITSAGHTRISALADEIGWTRQHLNTRFREQIGLTPKTVARVWRLHRAASMMTRPSPPPWSDIALACGYSDQSHLNRDFRMLTGGAPSEYFPVDPLRFLPADEASMVNTPSPACDPALSPASPRPARRPLAAGARA
jgi:AraC-like DNA-binding protein